MNKRCHACGGKIERRYGLLKQTNYACKNCGAEYRVSSWAKWLALLSFSTALPVYFLLSVLMNFWGAVLFTFVIQIVVYETILYLGVVEKSRN